MPLSIRTARTDDVAALTVIARRAKASHGYPGAWLDAWQDELSFDAAYLERHDVLVAAVGDRPIGVAALEHDGVRGEVAHLWVAPAAQGRGVGCALVQALAERARALGVTALRIVADPNAVGFYERLGARVVGTAPAPMPGAEDRTLPVLVLDLS